MFYSKIAAIKVGAWGTLTRTMAGLFFRRKTAASTVDESEIPQTMGFTTDHNVKDIINKVRTLFPKFAIAPTLMN